MAPKLVSGKMREVLSIKSLVILQTMENLAKVSYTSGAGNDHFRDLQTTANDLRKAEKT